MSVKESIEKKLNLIESMPNSETKRRMLEKAKGYLLKHDGADRIVTSKEVEEHLRKNPLPKWYNNNRWEEYTQQ